MKLGLRIFAGFFLIVGLAAFLTARVFVEEVKPGVRQAMEDTLVDTAQLLAAIAAVDLKQGTIADGALAKGLAQVSQRELAANIWGFTKSAVEYRVYVTDLTGKVLYDSAGKAVGADYSQWNDVARTLRGEYGARSSRSVSSDPASSVMHVAAAIKDEQGALLGVLTVAKPNSAIQPFIDRSVRKVLWAGLLLVGAAGAIGLLCTLWLVRRVRNLERYARGVAEGERVELGQVGAAGTELAELALAIETMRVKLEDKQYVERYVSELTHELKSPLAAIQGAAELLEEGLPEAERRRFAGNVLRQTERLRSLVSRLLALAEVEQRRKVAEAQPVELNALARRVAGEVAAAAGRASAAIDLCGPKDQVCAVTVRGDALLLEQALRNLLENALSFSPPEGRVELEVVPIESTGRTGAPGGAIIVRDRGPGLPDFALERAFERFFSLPRPGEREKGTGLGLCFAREVARLHNGEVTLRNREGGGAEATLQLGLGA